MPNSIESEKKSQSSGVPLKSITVEPQNIDVTVLFRTRLEHLSRRVRDALRETQDEKLKEFVSVPLREAEHLLEMSSMLRRGLRDTAMVDRLPS